jgi:hypothetical protein
MKRKTANVLHVCSFSSGIDEMKRKDQASQAAVLRVLAQCKRFSVFEATANRTIALTMDSLVEDGLVALDSASTSYPWTNVKLTKKGEEFVNDHPAHRNVTVRRMAHE